MQASDFNISPSFKTLKLLAFKVSPLDVISTIISEEPVKGYVSVAPKLLTNLNWVTPLENKNSPVKFGYFVATANNLRILKDGLILRSQAVLMQSKLSTKKVGIKKIIRVLA